MDGRRRRRMNEKMTMEMLCHTPAQNIFNCLCVCVGFNYECYLAGFIQMMMTVMIYKTSIPNKQIYILYGIYEQIKKYAYIKDIYSLKMVDYKNDIHLLKHYPCKNPLKVVPTI